MLENKITLKGEYIFKISFNRPLWGTIELKSSKKYNEITQEGLKYLINRLYNNNEDPIKHLTIAQGKNPTKLENEITKETKTTHNMVKNDITFAAVFSNQEIKDMQQIGLKSKINGALLTHSTFQKPFTPLGDNTSVNIEYILRFTGD